MTRTRTPSSHHGSESLRRRGVPRGFSTSRTALATLTRHHRTSLARSVAVALLDVGAPIALAMLGLQLFAATPPWIWIPAHGLILVAVARFQRGQENLTHEASHQNWCRLTAEDRARLARLGIPARLQTRLAAMANDIAANLLTALPTFSTVRSYWQGHRRHHLAFDSDDDPCRDRFVGLGRADPGAFLRALVRGMGSYLSGWWLAFGLRPITVVAGLSWHLCVWWLPWSLALGWAPGLAVWLVYWAAPYIVVLPWLRFVSESAKHRYGADTELEATISNLGPVHRLFFHPHGDGYHVLHHWDPAIPHHRLAETHRQLLTVDPKTYGARHPHRYRVLQDPDQGLHAGGAKGTRRTG